MTPHQNSVDPQTLGAMALGMAAGLVVADRIGRTGRDVASVALLTVGLVATVPFLAKYAARQWNNPTHRMGSRKTLASIRHSGVTELSEFSLNEPEPAKRWPAPATA